MNIELTRKALEKVGNPHILINLVSRRVRQISMGGGGHSRPLVEASATMDLADIALLEIIEEKVGWENTNPIPELPEVVAPKKKRASRKSAPAPVAAQPVPEPIAAAPNALALALLSDLGTPEVPESRPEISASTEVQDIAEDRAEVELATL